MPFAFTTEQRDLADGVASLLADRATGSYAREVVAGQADWRDLWSQLEELGIATIAVPESEGGLGLGAVELAAVCEAAGHFLVPAPLVATAGWFVPVVHAAGGAAGETLVSVLSGAAATLGYVDPATRSGSIELEGDRLTVADLLVADADKVDQIGFVVGDEGALRVAVVPATKLTIVPADGLDPTRPLSCVVADKVAAAVSPLPDVALAVAFVAAAAEQIGVAAEMLAITVRYAGEREQFGSKIGSFQGVKHRLVDALLLVERARSLTFRAAVLAAADVPSADLLQAAHLAKAAAAEAATEVARSTVQAHGGVGLTAEHDISLFYLRARQGSVELGGPDGHYAAATRSFLASGATG